MDLDAIVSEVCFEYSIGHLIRPVSSKCLTHIRWQAIVRETCSALLALCEGNSPVTGEFPLQRPVTQSFGVFFWSAPEQTVD